MDSKVYTKLQLITLVALRVIIGWHLLYEGVSKLLTPGWSSIGFLSESQWIMSGSAKWIISHSGVLTTVDFLNVWGLITIGLGLILGLSTRIAAFSGAVLVLIYYFNNAPIIGIEYSIPAEGNNLIVNKTLIEAVALLVLTVFPTGSIVGLDVFIARFKNIKKNIKWLKKKN
jgi:thiosulfate dehydrogenase (quinone) large subunit